MSKKRRILKIIAVISLVIGLAAITFPIFIRWVGEKESQELMDKFIKEIEEEGNEEKVADKEEDQESSTLSKEDAETLSKEEVIGIIEIESIGIRYPIIEGTDAAVLAKGIGHLTDTYGVGEAGNCVLCGHNGYRGGTFFTPLNTVQFGDIVSILDKKGRYHYYKIVNTKVVGPYDNTIKATDGTERLTLFTCTNHGTKRFVCECEVADSK